MIKLTFLMNREVFNVYIDKEEVWYRDRKWEKGIRLIPRDEEFVKKIKMSRNSIPNFLLDLFKLTEKEKEEYEKAKGSEAFLSDLIIKDCKNIGAKVLKIE